MSLKRSILGMGVQYSKNTILKQYCTRVQYRGVQYPLSLRERGVVCTPTGYPPTPLEIKTEFCTPPPTPTINQRTKIMTQTKIGLTAIDPGASGGIAWIDHDGQVQTAKTPETNGDFVSLLTGLRIAYGARWEVFLEDVPFGIGSGANVAAMAKLQRRAGIVEGVVQALGGRMVMVTPQRWQKPFGLGTRKSAGGPRQWKNKLKGEAQRRFPGVEVTLDISDALLILDYARGVKEVAE